MPEGGLDRPGQNHLLGGLRTDVETLMDSGGVYIPITPVQIFTDSTPVLNTWTDIDVSSYVPAGTIAIATNLNIGKWSTGASDASLYIDKKDRSPHSTYTYATVALEITNYLQNMPICEVDSNRYIQYYAYANPAVGAWNACQIRLIGYFIKPGDM